MRIDVQRRALPLRVVLAAWASCAAAALLPLSLPPTLRALFIVGFVFGGPALVAAVASSPVVAVRRSGREGALARRGDHVEIEHGGRSVRLPMRALDGAWKEGTRIVLSFKGRVIVRAEAGERADAILADLGYGPGGRASRVPVGARSSALGRSVLAPVSMLTGLAGASMALSAIIALASSSAVLAVMGLLFATGAFAISMACARAMVGSSLVLGADGVWIRRGVVSRYVSFGDDIGPRAVGRKVYLGGTELCVASSPIEANELLRQIAQRRDRARAETKDATLAEALDRGEHDVNEWAEQVKRLAAASSYRDRAVTDEALAAIVEDAREAPDRRAAAALALGSRGGEPARQRVRVAAEACAHPKLRVSLEAAAEGELDADAIRAVKRSMKR